MTHENKVAADFADKVKDISSKLKIDPSHLMMAMYKETGGTFSPKIKNPTSSASGLIQFMEATAKRLGTTTAALRKMSAIDQLDYVYKYFKPFAGKLHSFADVYLAIFYPAAIGKPDSYKLPTWVYNANKGLDIDKNKYITVGEFKKWSLRGQPGQKSTINKPKNNSIPAKGKNTTGTALFFGLLIVGVYLYNR